MGMSNVLVKKDPLKVRLWVWSFHWLMLSWQGSSPEPANKVNRDQVWAITFYFIKQMNCCMRCLHTSANCYPCTVDKQPSDDMFSQCIFYCLGFAIYQITLKLLPQETSKFCFCVGLSSAWDNNEILGNTASLRTIYKNVK